VGLLGLSMGGAVAACLAEKVQARSLVLWSAVAHTARLRELARSTGKPVPGRRGALEFNAREASARFLADVLKVEPIRHLARYEGPTLIVHSDKDEHVPVSHARDFYQASGSSNKEIAIISGADHVFTSISWEREVIARSVDWFGRCL
jgi:esterase/lipase